MTARAMWKGVIRFGRAAVPVKLYAAVQDLGIHFRLLHAPDLVPVQQRMVHARSGRPVPPDQIRRGFEVEKGRILLLSAEELAALEPPESRDIEITRFVEPGAVGHQWYDRPYYLGPDGPAAPYFALAEAMRNEGLAGVAAWTMRRKSYRAVLRSMDGYLSLITLRHAEEVVDVSEVTAPEGRDLTPPELNMARQLVEALAGDFDPSAYRDEYRQRLMELIQTKARGGLVEFEKAAERKLPAVSLEEMLRQSVRNAREQRKIA